MTNFRPGDKAEFRQAYVGDIEAHSIYRSCVEENHELTVLEADEEDLTYFDQHTECECGRYWWVMSFWLEPLEVELQDRTAWFQEIMGVNYL